MYLVCRLFFPEVLFVCFQTLSLIIPTWQWDGKQLHQPILAVLAIFFTTGKVIRTPLSQLHLEAVATSLHLTRQQLGFAEVASDVAPQVRQLVYAVAGVRLTRWIVLENCKS